MLGEVLTALNIIKAVIDIWDRIKPSPKADSARELGLQVEAGNGAQNRFYIGVLLQSCDGIPQFQLLTLATLVHLTL